MESVLRVHADMVTVGWGVIWRRWGNGVGHRSPGEGARCIWPAAAVAFVPGAEGTGEGSTPPG
jgi:hypothetical protein